MVSHGLAALEFLISRPASLLLLDAPWFARGTRTFLARNSVMRCHEVMMPEMSGQHVLPFGCMALISCCQEDSYCKSKEGGAQVVHEGTTAGDYHFCTEQPGTDGTRAV